MPWSPWKWRAWSRPVITAILIGAIWSQPIRATAARQVFIGEAIPRRLYVGSSFLFQGSDTLLLNGVRLHRDVDYAFDSHQRAFDFSALVHGPHDTLEVRYEKLPAWVPLGYGFQEMLPKTSESQIISRSPGSSAGRQSLQGVSRPQGDIALSGAKTIRVSTGSGGQAEFSQTLNLHLEGDLTDQLQIRGTITDRGYDPAYGVANSRLNELDRLNLALASPRFNMQLGDILWSDPLGGKAKDVSGGAAEYRAPAWSLSGAAARPKGHYAAAKFNGRDGVQGPYALVPTGQAAVVPNSETVWLDGRQLQRGADADYMMDYPVGQIVFNVNRPIDSRSRIEVDYEPLSTVYKGELLAAGGSVSLGDSSVTVGVHWLREGDDANQRQLGELSAADRQQLQVAGDQSAQRSGVVVDSAGDYILLSDSLPDTVYQYVGKGKGGYDVTFSYVGDNAGAYDFLGTDVYRYVGLGNGDYLPVVTISAPERTEYAQSELRIASRSLGDWSFRLQQSDHDRNLLSSIDDSDNRGVLAEAAGRHSLSSGDKAGAVEYHYRFKEDTYLERARLNRPDFARDYFLPTALVVDRDERLHETAIVTPRLGGLTVRTEAGWLDYRGRFRSRRTGVDISYSPTSRLTTSAGWQTIRTTLDTLALERRGTADRWLAGSRLDLGHTMNLRAEWEQDQRRHDYTGAQQGTRYQQWRLTAAVWHETISFERYQEDSLSRAWDDQLTRRRLTVTSVRRLADVTYDASYIRQWLSQRSGVTNTNLARLNYRYMPQRRPLTVSGSYAISEEIRQARGVTYLEVTSGQGQYRFEDGQYVPDADGDFIQVEELLSDKASVRRGEKSFHYRQSWSAATVSFNSDIEEELLASGRRSAAWLIPFWSDADQPYLFFRRVYDAEARLVPWREFYFLNFSARDELQSRLIASAPQQRRSRQQTTTLNEISGAWLFEQSLEVFAVDRDEYFTAAGDIDGYRARIGTRYLLPAGEVGVQCGYRKAQSARDETARNESVTLIGRWQVAQHGEWSASLELYRQDLDNVIGAPTFTLTDNRPGTRGAIWQSGLRYGLRSGVRVNATISGRHADDRRARLTARAEMVAEF